MLQAVTARDALDILIKYGVEVLFDNKPVGISLTECVHSAIDIAQGIELDYAIDKTMYLVRDIRETDASFRERAKLYGIEYDLMTGYFARTLIKDTKKSCNHVWKKYTGFTDTYDYCINCPEKKR